MHDHRDILELAAAAIDFDLDPAERARLSEALETCVLCRRQASAMRATATVLRRPSAIGTPGSVRDVVLGTALRGNRRPFRFGSLVVATLALMTLVGGTVLVTGNRGFTLVPAPTLPAPPSSPPSVPTITVEPTFVPAPTPTASPTAIASEPSAVPGERIQDGEIAAMVTDGRLVIRTKPGTGPDSAIFKTKIYPGQRVLVLEGAVEASGYPWFRVRIGQVEGWVAGAGLDGELWLAPVRNGLIAFVGDVDAPTGVAPEGSSEAIFVIDPTETTPARVLLADPNLVPMQLTWSPDGRRLAFVGLPISADIDTPPDIFVIDADGSNLVRVTQTDLFEDSPAWSPDSTRLAFRQAQPNPVTDPVVVVANADGSGSRILGPGENPVWAPDGQQLAMTVPEGGSSRVWLQGPDGDNRRLAAGISVASTRPAWSPDGQSLLVSSSGLALIDLSSGSITNVSVQPASASAWSIGGTIAFTTSGSASPALYTVEPDGSGLRRVSGDLTVDLVPTWSPDGMLLLLVSEARHTQHVVMEPLCQCVALGGNEAMRSPAWQPRVLPGWPD